MTVDHLLRLVGSVEPEIETMKRHGNACPSEANRLVIIKKAGAAWIFAHTLTANSDQKCAIRASTHC